MFAEEVQSKRSNSGVSYGVGGGLVNVPAQKARRRVVWDAAAAARTNMDDDKRRELDRWKTVVR